MKIKIKRILLDCTCWKKIPQMAGPRRARTVSLRLGVAFKVRLKIQSRNDQTKKHPLKITNDNSNSK